MFSTNRENRLYHCSNGKLSSGARLLLYQQQHAGEQAHRAYQQKVELSRRQSHPLSNQRRKEQAIRVKEVARLTEASPASHQRESQSRLQRLTYYAISLRAAALVKEPRRAWLALKERRCNAPQHPHEAPHPDRIPLPDWIRPLLDHLHSHPRSIYLPGPDQLTLRLPSWISPTTDPHLHLAGQSQAGIPAPHRPIPHLHISQEGRASRHL